MAADIGMPTIVYLRVLSLEELPCEARTYPGQDSSALLCLDGLHEAVPQESDPSPSIALALEELQTVAMALDDPIAPGQGEPSLYGREVFLKPLAFR